MKINNYRELATTSLKKHALDIASAGILAALPFTYFSQYISYTHKQLKIKEDVYDLSKGKLYVIGAGKAAGLMAQSLERIIPPYAIAAGFVNTIAPAPRTEKIILNEASHPIPDEAGFYGTERMLALPKHLKEGDTVICLISGGGSAMMPAPVAGVSFQDKKKFNEILLKCGVDHYEINILRKVVSQVKGGKLARLLQPAQVITLIVSDDFGGKDDVASGPTFYDGATFEEAYALLVKYKILDSIPLSIRTYVEKGIRREVPGNPAKDEPFWKKVHNYTVADNKKSLAAMQKEAEKAGYQAHILPEVLTGDVHDAARKMSLLFNEYAQTKMSPSALIFSSETTVNVCGTGKGGRNQEFIASLINSLPQNRVCAVASVGTDGLDFIPGVAGAIADHTTATLARQKGLSVQNFIDQNDTFHLHQQLGNLILSEPTGTHVGDLHVYLQDALQ